MMFEWFDEHEFHFKEHDDWTIQSRDQATSSFKDHMHSNELSKEFWVGGLNYYVKIYSNHK